MILFLNILLMFFLQNGVEKKQMGGEHNAQTLVVVFSILKGKDRPIVILETKQMLEGRPRDLRKMESEKGDLQCVLLSKTGKELDSVLVANPLVQDVEFLNEKDELTKRRIMLDSTAFMVRIAMQNGASRLIVRMAKEKKVLMGFDIK